ncbi:MAG: TonB-dependent receptor domain-containing protein [Terriglobia bacterium]
MRSNQAVKIRMLSMFLVAGAALWGVTAVAQFTTASLRGRVTDPSGASIPGAVVSAKNTATGVVQTTRTGATGAYLFPNLTIGSYDLTVRATGFVAYVQHGITLTVNQTATQNVKLKVGQVTQQITVRSNTTLVTTQSASLGQIVNQQSVVNLPLNGREVQQLVFLAPGVTNVTSHYCGANCEGGVLPGEQYAKVNGTTSNSVNYQMDGTDNNDTYINVNLPFPDPDAVQEFNVQTGNMSAAYGNAVGGVVDVVTKSGTNQIHGDGFEFVRNGPLFDARNYFAPTSDALKQNQFGGSFGGPILKDKLFYFGSYEGTRIHTAPQGQISFVPTAAERGGDFSDLLPTTPLVDPATSVPFPNNVIPASDLSPVSKYFLQFIPEPNGPGRQLTYIGSPSINDTDQFLTKIDYYVGKHHISGRYFYLNFTSPPFVPPKTNILEANPNGNKVKVQTISINDIYNVTPHLMLNTWFGWNQQNGGSLSDAPFSIADAGVKVATTTPPELVVCVGGGFSINTNHYGAFNRGDQTVREVATLMRGTHELQFGGEVLRVRAPMANEFEQNGEFYFTNDLSGDNISDFMLGNVSQFIQAGGLYLNFTGINWSAFIQDNWQATHRLMLNLGLRWDPFLPYQDSEGRVGCFVPGAHSTRYPNSPTDLIFGGSNHDPGCPPASMYSSLSNFAPRLGFAYRLTQDGKSSIRGGVGYYYQPPNTVAFQDVVGIPPFAPIINLTDVNFADPYGSAGVANPFPASYGPKLPGPSATFPSDISFTQIFNKNFRLPQILSWNLIFERQFGTSWLLRATYSGNKGTYEFGTDDQETGLQALNPAIYIPGVAPNGQPLSTEANTQQRRIYPDFGFVNEIVSAINSNYNGLSLSMQKRVSRGLSVLGSYTWSKGLNDFAPLGAYSSNTDPFNREFDYGPSDDDLTNVIKFDGIYHFPHANLSGFAGKLTNGWSLSTILNWQGGFPYSILSGYDNSFSGVDEDRADLTTANIHDASLSPSRPHGQLINEWFNTAVFAPNTVGTFGNSGKNFLRGPGLFDTDLALLKNTKLSERLSVELRAEFFNAFNNVNFGMPDATLTDSAFGQITSASDPRILQFALKFFF